MPLARFIVISLLAQAVAAQAQSASPSRALETVIEKAWERLLEDETPVAQEREFITRNRTVVTNYPCRTQCFCIATRVGEALLADTPSRYIYPLHVRGTRGPLVVKVGADRPKSKAYDFHVALFVEVAPGSVWVFDPIVFHDQKLHRPTSWRERFVTPWTEMRFSRYDSDRRSKSR